jgi:hypothetical protein
MAPYHKTSRYRATAQDTEPGITDAEWLKSRAIRPNREFDTQPAEPVPQRAGTTKPGTAFQRWFTDTAKTNSE